MRLYQGPQTICRADPDVDHGRLWSARGEIVPMGHADEWNLVRDGQWSRRISAFRLTARKGVNETCKIGPRISKKVIDPPDR